MLRERPPYFSTRNTGQAYRSYYRAQCGHGVNVYSGRPFQNGHGLGGALLGLMRSATPLFKTVGKTLLRAGVGVAKDMMDGGTFKSSLKNRATNALRDLAGGRTTRARKRAPAKRKRSQTGNGRERKNTRTARVDIFS